MTRAMYRISIRLNVWRELMPSKLCACCGLSFQPVPQVPDQTYCSESACQRARRQRWYRQKLATDPDYLDNKRRTQRGWMDRNPDYWRQYRAEHPDYAQRNRQRAKVLSTEPIDLAKIDESNRPQVLKGGIYRITSVQTESSEKLGTWLVKISPICPADNCDGGCKGDACKDRM